MSRQRKFSKSDIPLAQSMLDLGDSLDAVAKHFGVTRQTIWRYLGNTSNRSTARVDESIKFLVNQSWDKGLSVVEIAAKFELGQSTVYRILNERKQETEQVNVNPVEPPAKRGPRRHTGLHRPRR